MKKWVLFLSFLLALLCAVLWVQTNNGLSGKLKEFLGKDASVGEVKELILQGDASVTYPEEDYNSEDYNEDSDYDEYEEDTIYEAVVEGNISVLADYINSLTPEEEEEQAEGADADYSFEKRLTVLYHAMDLQKIDIFEFFLKDMDINGSVDWEGNTLLHEAARYGYTEIIKCLLSRNADINQGNRAGITPVIAALESDYPEIVAFLKEKGANLNIKVKEGPNYYDELPIIFKYYYERNGYTLLRRYIEAGADINIRGYNGETILFWAAGGYGSDMKLASYLIENNADVNVKNNEGQTPLFGATGLYDINIAKLLIDNHADVNAADKALRTPLFEALNYNNDEVVEYMLVKGAKINHRDIWGETPLHVAAGENNIGMVKLLVENGADIHAKNNEGHTPIYNTSLISEQGKAVIEYLTSKGADPEDAGLGGTFKLDFSM